MRTSAFIYLIAFLPLTSYAAFSTAPFDPVSVRILGNLDGNIGGSFAARVDPSYLFPLDPSAAVGLNVPGTTGGLTQPACVAETARRAALTPPQPPPSGDFPCVVPTFNSSGIVDGVCFATVCRGVASTGLDGQLFALDTVSPLSSVASGIAEKLAQGSPSTPPSSYGFASPPQTSLPTPPFTFQRLTTGFAQPLDMSRLFRDSAVIVGNLLRALNL